MEAARPGCAVLFKEFLLKEGEMTTICVMEAFCVDVEAMGNWVHLTAFLYECDERIETVVGPETRFL
jgi:hypothetical protein